MIKYSNSSVSLLFSFFSKHSLINCTANRNNWSNECKPLATQELKSILITNKPSVFQINLLYHVNFYSKQSDKWVTSAENKVKPIYYSFSFHLILWVWVKFNQCRVMLKANTFIWWVSFLIKEGALNFLSGQHSGKCSFSVMLHLLLESFIMKSIHLKEGVGN